MPGSTTSERKSEKTSFKSFTREQKLVFLSLSYGYISLFSTETLIQPSFPAEGEKHGVSSSITGIVFSVSALMAVCASPFIGPLIANFGPKKVLMSGIALYGTFMILFGFLEHVPYSQTPWFVAGCFISLGFASFGATAVYTATLTYAAQMFPNNMSFVVGTTETFIAVAEIIGLLSGGVLNDIGGYKLPIILFACLHLLAVPLDLFLLPPDVIEKTEKDVNKPQNKKLVNFETTNGTDKDNYNCKNSFQMYSFDSVGPQEGVEKEIKKEEEIGRLKNGKEIPAKLRLWHLFVIPRTALMALVIAVSGISWSFLGSTLEPHLSSLMLTATQRNLMFLLTSVTYGLSSPLWGWVADRMKNTWILIAVALCLGGITFCFLGPLPLLGLENTVWQNIVCLTIITTALAAAGIPACEAVLYYTLEAGHRDNIETYAIVSSLIATMYSAGAAIGSFSGGFLIDNLGYPTSAAICGCICVLSGMAVTCYFLFCYTKSPKIPRAAP